MSDDFDPAVDAYANATFCDICGRESCEDHVPPTPEAAATETPYELRLRVAVEMERVRREARRLVDAELRPVAPKPPRQELRAFLATPDPSRPARIAGWQPANSRILVSAQYKSGKSVLVHNWLRSLVDGDPFLGRDTVVAIDGTAALIDLELDPGQAKTWLRRQCIRDDDRISYYNLKGAAASFNLMDDAAREAWATDLRAHNTQALAFDCVRPVLDAIGLDEQKDAGQFLSAFDALLAEAGIRDALVVTHMGHTGERARGDSRFRDWPDAEWRLMRKDDNPRSQRFIAAYGRDVDIPESSLVYDTLSQHLTIEDGSRATVALREALDAIEALLAIEEPLSGRGIKDALAGGEHARNTLEAALRCGVREHVLAVTPGAHNANLYRRVGG